MYRGSNLRDYFFPHPPLWAGLITLIGLIPITVYISAISQPFELKFFVMTFYIWGSNLGTNFFHSPTFGGVNNFNRVKFHNSLYLCHFSTLWADIFYDEFLRIDILGTNFFPTPTLGSFYNLNSVKFHNSPYLCHFSTFWAEIFCDYCPHWARPSAWLSSAPACFQTLTTFSNFDDSLDFWQPYSNFDNIFKFWRQFRLLTTLFKFWQHFQILTTV